MHTVLWIVCAVNTDQHSFNTYVPYSLIFMHLTKYTWFTVDQSFGSSTFRHNSKDAVFFFSANTQIIRMRIMKFSVQFQFVKLILRKQINWIEVQNADAIARAHWKLAARQTSALNVHGFCASDNRTYTYADGVSCRRDSVSLQLLFCCTGKKNVKIINKIHSTQIRMCIMSMFVCVFFFVVVTSFWIQFNRHCIENKN